MLTLTLILASFTTSLTDNTPSNPKGVENTPATAELAAPDLTLMDGYDRYLADPKMMLPEQRDA